MWVFFEYELELLEFKRQRLALTFKHLVFSSEILQLINRPLLVCFIAYCCKVLGGESGVIVACSADLLTKLTDLIMVILVDKHGIFILLLLNLDSPFQ